MQTFKLHGQTYYFEPLQSSKQPTLLGWMRNGQTGQHYQIFTDSFMLSSSPVSVTLSDDFLRIIRFIQTGETGTAGEPELIGTLEGRTLEQWRTYFERVEFSAFHSVQKLIREADDITELCEAIDGRDFSTDYDNETRTFHIINGCVMTCPEGQTIGLNTLSGCLETFENTNDPFYSDDTGE